jgi:hypothetical protein
MGEQPLVHDDLVEPSEAFRRRLDYFLHSTNAPAQIDKLARLRPETLACMHGSVLVRGRRRPPSQARPIADSHDGVSGTRDGHESPWLGREGFGDNAVADVRHPI